MTLQSSLQLLDVMTENPAWVELADIMSKVNDETVLAQVTELLNIRNVTSESDLTVVQNSLRMAGINLSSSLLRSQAQRLGQAFDRVHDYGDLVDSEYWSRYCAFLLDDLFNAARLWTADYSSFYRDPQGSKVIDGGSWYKTTHVELEIGASAIDAGFDLAVTADMQPLIVQLLVDSGAMDESQAQDWATNHFGLVVQNDDPIQRLVRNYIFSYRVTDFFYQWAPIEDVLDRIVVTTQAAAALSVGVRAVVEPFIYNEVGQRSVAESKFVLYPSNVVRPNAKLRFSYYIKYEDGSEETTAATVDPMTDISGSGDGWCTFLPPDWRKTVSITLRSGQASAVMNLVLESGTNVIDPTELRIFAEKNPAYAGTNVKFRAFATYAAGGTLDITDDSGYLVWSSDFGTFNGATLVLPESVVDRNVLVRCVYTGVARTLETEFQLAVNKSLASLVPVKISIEAPAEVMQGQDTELKALVTYNDGTTAYVHPVWYASSQKTDIVGDVLSSEVYVVDYKSTIVAEYSEGIDYIRASQNIVFKSRNWKITDLRIRCPDRMQERTVYYPEAQVYVVDGDATAEQIASGDSRYVRGWRKVTSPLWFGITGEDYIAMPSINPKTGETYAPNVKTEVAFGIGFRASMYGKPISTRKKVTVYDTVLSVKYIDVLVAGYIQSTSTVAMRALGLWTNGDRTELDAQYALEFSPSAAAIDEVRADIERQIADRLAQGQDASDLDPNNPDYTQYVQLSLVDVNTTGYDPYANSTFTRKGIFFSGTLAGNAVLTTSYTAGGQTTTETTIIPLSPTRKRVESLVLEVPEVIGERSRTFLRALANYTDGTSDYVECDWWATWYDSDGNPNLFNFSTREYTGAELCVTLNNVAPTSFEEFLTLSASRLAIFSGVTTLEDAMALKAVGTILQVASTELELVVDISARYFATRATQSVTITAHVPEPVNTILESRIIGPVEVSANAKYASYALVNKYQLTGVRHLADGTELSTGTYDFEVEESNDWLITEQAVLAGETGYEASADAIAVIDSDGYLTPLRNVEGYVVIRAVFDDNYNKFSRELRVYIHSYNTYLGALQILGQSVVSDDAAKNKFVSYSDGVWYIPYTCRVIATDGTIIDPPNNKVQWHMYSGVDGVRFDADLARLYVTPLLSDATVTLEGTYSAEVGATTETVIGRIDVQIQAEAAVVSGYIDFTDAAIYPDADIPLAMQYTRRNGHSSSSLAPDKTSVGFSWSLRSAPSGVTLTGNVLRFPSSDTEQTAVVQCVLTEQRTVLEEAIEVTCNGIGYPTGLTLDGYQRIRDDSIVNFSAVVSRADRPSTTETEKCLWSLQDQAGNTITLNSISIDPRRGVLTSGVLSQDIVVFVNCLFVEGKFRYEERMQVQLISSLPRYGVGPFGVDTLQEVEQLQGRLNSTAGGSFILDAREGQYGYFACREDYGTVKLLDSALPNGVTNTSYGGWDGASWTLTDFSGTGPIFVEKVYDNVTDRIAIYRSNNRAGLLAKFTVQYL